MPYYIPFARIGLPMQCIYTAVQIMLPDTGIPTRKIISRNVRLYSAVGLTCVGLVDRFINLVRQYMGQSMYM